MTANIPIRSGLTVDGNVTATGKIKGTQATASGEAVMLGNDGYVPIGLLPDAAKGVQAGTGISVDSTTTPSTVSLEAINPAPTGTYGPSADVAPAMGGAFNVPQVTVDTYGRVTTAVSRTITMPSLTSETSAGATLVYDVTGAGVVRKSNSTVGGEYQPIYMSAGALTAGGVTFGLTDVTIEEVD